MKGECGRGRGTLVLAGPARGLGGHTGKESEGKPQGFLGEGLEIDSDDLVLAQVEHVDQGLVASAALGIVRASFGRVERDNTGVVVVGALDRARTESEDHAEHPGPGIDIGAPGVGVERESHAREMREETVALADSGNALDQQPHAFFVFENAVRSR